MDDLGRRRGARTAAPPGPPDLRARADPRILVDLAERMTGLAAERAGLEPTGEEPARRAARLRDHLAGHVLPRARSLEAPLLVLLIGPTGAGKSSLLNALAGRAVSRSGVLRPTTRELVALIRPEARDALLADGAPLALLAGARVRVVEDPDAPEGIALVDAPDVDSVEHANRALTDRLAEAADLGLFVTTATRYADRVPWDVLARARDRGLPLVVVVNRMPEDAGDRAAVQADIVRLLGEFGIATDAPGGPTVNGGTTASGAIVEVLPIREGALDPAIDGLDRDAVAPLRDRIAALGRDRDARRALAARALAGSLAGLAPLAERVADDLEHEAIEADALRRLATGAFATELATLREDVGRGRFLRAEALRQWQQFVGADEVTRFFSSGIGKVRGTVSALLGGMPRAPVAEVRDEALEDLRALARSHAGEASRRIATAWSDEPALRTVLTDDPSIWSPSPTFDTRLAGRLEAWIEAIGEDVRATGGGKRRLARGASLGVNTIGVGVMLAAFAHTGGITGTEVGVAAATGFLNQKLLEALFGEAALVEMIARARRGLADAMTATFDEELERYERLVPDGGELRGLAARLRQAAGEVATLGSMGAQPASTPPGRLSSGVPSSTPATLR
jgi:energy-coupling factor transporter ATP-binding protein EcfA2